MRQCNVLLECRAEQLCPPKLILRQDENQIKLNVQTHPPP